MSHIAFLLSKPQMLADTEYVVKCEGLQNFSIKPTTLDNVVEEALKSTADGADVIVARGVQASIIKQNTKVPVVEIRLTGQEIGRLIVQAKEMLGIPYPMIGLVGFGNMFCDTTYMSEIFHADIRTYFIEQAAEMGRAVEQAVNDGVNLIIGGEMAIGFAKQLGLPYLFYSSTVDSIREAVRVAKDVCYAVELEKKNTAQLQAVLDYSFNGILKLDSNGNILLVNHVMESLFDCRSEALLGKPISGLIPDLDSQKLAQVLEKGDELYSVYIKIKKLPMIANIAPIFVGDEVEGAIVFCHELERLKQMESTVYEEMNLNSGKNNINFNMITQKNPKMHRCVEEAKLFAQSDSPILFYGRGGNEEELLAQSIHNSSERRDQPFYFVRCEGLSPQTQQQFLFGTESGQGSTIGIVRAANRGTLFLQGINWLDLRLQHWLLSIIKNKSFLHVKTSERPEFSPADIRVLASSSRNLSILVNEGKFCPELYYFLCAFTVEIPAISSCPEDCDFMIDAYIKKYSKKYDKYIVLTEGARHTLLSYSWDGNLIQLESFIERMVLSAEHRSVEEAFVSYLLEHLYPVMQKAGDPERILVFKDPQAVRIMQLLNQYGGNRDMVAQKLNVSKSTLWRYMKKYGIGRPKMLDQLNDHEFKSP